MMNDEIYMKEALKQAEIAYSCLEVPVGCVIVKDDKIISSGYNLRESLKSPILHAEIVAIEKAAKILNSWRLINCTLYVTLEPCCMCAGAIIHSRISRVVFGANDYKSGVLGSKFNINYFGLNHKFKVTPNILEDESSLILTKFFTKLRESKVDIL